MSRAWNPFKEMNDRHKIYFGGARSGKSVPERLVPVTERELRLVAQTQRECSEFHAQVEKVYQRTIDELGGLPEAERSQP